MNRALRNTLTGCGVDAGLWRCRRARAFTLVEMLVVVALISILTAFVGFSITGQSQGEVLMGAQRNLLSMVESARICAELQGTRARLIIYSDRNAQPPMSPNASVANAKVLRYFGVIYAASDDPTVPVGQIPGIITAAKPYNVWIAANRGAYLPRGIYFVPQQNSDFAQNIPNFATTNNAITSQYYYQPAVAVNPNPGVTTGVMQLDYPVAQAVEGKGEWYYFIEFSPGGFYYNTNNNNNIIIGAAETVAENQVNFRPDAQGVNALYGGVQLRPLGGAVPFRSVDDIQQK